MIYCSLFVFWIWNYEETNDKIRKRNLIKELKATFPIFTRAFNSPQHLVHVTADTDQIKRQCATITAL